MKISGSTSGSAISNFSTKSENTKKKPNVELKCNYFSFFFLFLFFFSPFHHCLRRASLWPFEHFSDTNHLVFEICEKETKYMAFVKEFRLSLIYKFWKFTALKHNTWLLSTCYFLQTEKARKRDSSHIMTQLPLIGLVILPLENAGFFFSALIN